MNNVLSDLHYYLHIKLKKQAAQYASLVFDVGHNRSLDAEQSTGADAAAGTIMQVISPRLDTSSLPLIHYRVF